MKILTLNTHSLAEENATEKMELFAGILEKDTGHRKGTNYNKTARKFDVGIKTLKDVFENILEKADEFLLYLMKI